MVILYRRIAMREGRMIDAQGLLTDDGFVEKYSKVRIKEFLRADKQEL